MELKRGGWYKAYFNWMPIRYIIVHVISEDLGGIFIRR